MKKQNIIIPFSILAMVGIGIYLLTRKSSTVTTSVKLPANLKIPPPPTGYTQTITMTKVKDPKTGQMVDAICITTRGISKMGTPDIWITFYNAITGEIISSVATA